MYHTICLMSECHNYHTGQCLLVITTATALKYKLAPYGKAMVAKGAYVSSPACPLPSMLIFRNGQSIVYKATEQRSGTQVAVKKSRVSKTVKRPTLQHEIRVLQFLKGHSAIPAVYG